MKLGTVVTATDLNPLYMDFIPIFVKAWTTLFPEIDVVIVLIAHSIPDSLLDYKQYIHINSPIDGINTAFHAQCIRLLYPQYINREQGVLITDMDMIPMNRFYYEDAIKNIPDNVFICYRDVCLPTELPICYNIALPYVWASMFKEESIEKWYNNTEYDGSHGGIGWNTDQLILIKKFNEHEGSKIILNDNITKYNRLDRVFKNQFADRNTLRKQIAAGDYSDYHCLRPHSAHTEINNFIVDSLTVKQIETHSINVPTGNIRTIRVPWKTRFK